MDGFPAYGEVIMFHYSDCGADVNATTSVLTADTYTWKVVYYDGYDYTNSSDRTFIVVDTARAFPWLRRGEDAEEEREVRLAFLFLRLDKTIKGLPFIVVGG